MPPPELGSRSQPWFVRRRYGVGYRPLAWQGWVITGILVGATAAVFATVHTSTVRIVVVAALIVAYTAIGWRLSGERAEDGDAEADGEPADGAPRPRAELSPEQAAAVRELRASATPRPAGRRRTRRSWSTD